RLIQPGTTGGELPGADGCGPAGVDLGQDDPLAVVERGKDLAVRPEDRRPTAETDTALQPDAVRAHPVGSVLPCPLNPVGAGGLLAEPVRREADDIAAGQRQDPRGLGIFRVHADEDAEPT